MNNFYIVEKNNYRYLKKEEIAIKGIGHKGYGLTHVPSKWTLPFFVISKQMYKEFKSTKKDDRDKLVSLYVDGIQKCALKTRIESQWIIRSSACNESMDERGQYKSRVVDKSTLKDELFDLLLDLEKDDILCEEEVSFIVQHYIAKKISGHISNERRLSKDSRDYKIEYDIYGKTKQESLGIRKWRKNYNKEEIKNHYLECSKIQKIKEGLYFPSLYFQEKKQRVHLEFVWDGNKIYIVQCDYEINEKNTYNPKNQKIKMSSEKGTCSLNILREIDDKIDNIYYKIKNIFIYKKVGLKTVPLYILDNKKELKRIKEKKVSETLKNDIKQLLENSSIVIRTNIITNEHEKRQMSKRSNELKDLHSTIEWLQKAAEDLKGLKYVFIIHNFIPSISSAFVWVKPNSKFVKVQALWGLPEGLYYYPHDSFLIDLKNIDVNCVNNSHIVVKPNIRHKPCFISTNIDGSWSLKNTQIPWDWNPSIDEDSLKEIAVASQKIANLENKVLSVMWFVSVDKQYYGTKNLPWYHEEINDLIIEETDYIRKYFNDKEIVISNSSDLKKILKSGNDVKYIKIRPYEDEVLRDRDFLTKIGNICKEKNITIFLEGTVLAHSFYQLKKTGANIVVSDLFKDFHEKVELNKLVRDKIPENILKHGEIVEYGYVEDNLLIELLIKKIIEEAFEIYDAETRDEILIELADLYEVILRLKQEINMGKRFNNNHLNYKYIDGECLCEFNYSIFGRHKKSIQTTQYKICIYRKANEVFLEIRFFNNGHEINKESIKKETIKKMNYLQFLKSKILYISFKIFTSKKQYLYLLKPDLILLETYLKEILIYENCESCEFESVINKKRRKNGAFEKGYIIFNTLNSNSIFNQEFSEESLYRNNLFDMKFDTVKRVKEIPLEIKRNIDLLENNTKRILLIKIQIPTTFKSQKIELKRNKIDEYFGENKRVLVYIKQLSDKIYGRIYIVNDAYIQQKFELFLDGEEKNG